MNNEQYRHLYQNEYINDLKNRIHNAGNIIGLLLSDIQSNEDQLNNEIIQAENEIEKLRKEKNKKGSEMRQKMKSLKRKKWRKSIFGVVKTGSNLLNFLGPKGMVISSILNMAVDATDNLFDTFDSRKRYKRKSDDDKDEKKPNKIETISKTITDGFETYKVYKEIDKEMNELLETMEQNQEAIDDLNNRQLQINQIQIEIVQEIKSAIGELASNSTKSHAQLDYQKYKIKKTLDSIREKINKILKLFDDSKNELINTLTRFDNAMSTMIDIYSRIESTKDHIDFVGYLSIISNPSKSNGEIIDFAKNKYKTVLTRLEAKIRENILNEIYSKAMQAFRYWSFPFYCFYLEKIKLPKNGKNDINSLIKESSNRLNALLNIVQKDKMSIHAIDNYILTSHFSPRFPFYEWSFNESQYELHNLLNSYSHKATFPTFLDSKNFVLTNRIASLNGLKFSSLYLLVEAHSSPAKNESLNRILNEFRVELKYMGSSNYNFRGEHFKIPVNSIENEEIILSFDYGCSSLTCDQSNQSFKKLKNGRALLSPFTTWEISFIPSDFLSQNELLILNRKLKNVLNDDLSDITLKLCGIGQFINRKYDQIKLHC
jgi:hypothetical protein